MIKYYLKLFFIFIKMNIKSQLEYKKAFFIQVFGMILNDVSFLILWFLLFQNFKKSFELKE